MTAPRTRYARNGDVSIAYQVAGDGPHDVLLVNSWVSQMEHLWTEPRLARMFARLTSFARLIQFDRRGSGMSDRVPPAPLEEQMDDVLAVLDAAGCERADRARRDRGDRARLPVRGHAPRARPLARAVRADPAHRRRARLPVGARPGAARDVHRAQPSAAGGRA